jgi:hypothetical protein
LESKDDSNAARDEKHNPDGLGSHANRLNGVLVGAQPDAAQDECSNNPHPDLAEQIRP